MEFIVDKSALVHELGFLRKAVEEKRVTTPVLSNVLIEARDGKILLTATDFFLCIRSACSADVRKEGSGTAPVKKLFNYVCLLPEDEIRIKWLDNDCMRVTCGSSYAEMVGISGSSFPELPSMPFAGVEIPAALLSSMIAQTLFAISKEDSILSPGGALLLVKPSSLIMVSTDRCRLAYVEEMMETKLDKDLKILIPKRAVIEILRLAKDHGDGKVVIAHDDNYLFFEFGSRLLITQKLNKEFFSYDRALPESNSQTARLSRDEMKAALERVAQFADEDSHAIRLQFMPGEVKVSAYSFDFGESRESVSADYAGPEITIGFNVRYLLDFLYAVPDEKVYFRFNDHRSAMELNPAEGSCRYVVMPLMRV